MSSSSIASSSEDKCGGGGNKFNYSRSAHSPCTLHLLFFIRPICTVQYAIICRYHILKHKSCLDCVQTKTTHNYIPRSMWQNVYEVSLQVR